MARTQQQILRDYLGDQLIALIAMSAEVEALKAEKSELERRILALEKAIDVEAHKVLKP